MSTPEERENHATSCNKFPRAHDGHEKSDEEGARMDKLANNGSKRSIKMRPTRKELISGILSLVVAIAILHGFSISLGAFSAGVYVLYFGKVERNSKICLRMCCCLEVNSFSQSTVYSYT